MGRRARRNLLVTYHAYLIPFHEVLYNHWQSIELERITVPGSPLMLLRKDCLQCEVQRCHKSSILVTEKWRRKTNFLHSMHYLQQRAIPVPGKFSIPATPLIRGKSLPFIVKVIHTHELTHGKVTPVSVNSLITKHESADTDTCPPGKYHSENRQTCYHSKVPLTVPKEKIFPL